MPLYQVIESNQPEIVEVLLKAGAKAGLDLAYTKAFSEGYSEIEMLLKPTLGSDFSPHSLFFKAVHGQNIPLFNKLLNKGFGNYLKIDKGSELLVASVSKNSEIMKILLENGVNVNITSEFRSVTALHKAAFWGELDKVKLLLTYDAKVKVRDKENQFPVYMVISGIGKKRFIQGEKHDLNDFFKFTSPYRIFGENNDDPAYYKIPQRLEILKLLLREEQHLTKSEYGRLLNLIQNLQKSRSQEIVDFANEAYWIVRKYKS